METREQVLAPAQLAEFVFRLACVLVAAAKRDVVCFAAHGRESVYDTFINDPSQSSLFVYRDGPAAEHAGAEHTDGAALQDHSGHVTAPASAHSFGIAPAAKAVPASATAAFAIIKEAGPLTAASPLDTQLQIINLPLREAHDSKNSFEALRALVSLGIAPYFDTLSAKATASGGQAQEDDAGTLGIARKKISELALSLQHLQQTVQVPDLGLTVDVHVREIVRAHGSSDAQQSLLTFVDESVLAHSDFLNSLQSTVNGWIRSIQDITQLTHDVAGDQSAQDEISFWLSLETALASVQDQLKSPEVVLTLDILKAAKRFHATVGFLSETGIRASLSVAQRHTALLKDLPLDEILSASSFAKLEEAVAVVFNHLRRLRVTEYPIDRAIHLVEALSADVELKLRTILSQSNLMSLDPHAFDTVVAEAQDCFDTFDANVREFTNLARELLRKRNEKFILVKVDSKTSSLRERIDYVADFRHKHDELVDVIGQIDSQHGDLNSELQYAYSAVQWSNVTDLSIEGKRAWDSDEKLYRERTAAVQNTVIQMLRKLLAQTKNSNEMFEIFDNFKFLLAQDSIRNAIQEYQSQLLAVVKTNIKALQGQFLRQSEITKLFKLRDIPPVSATILWARQIQQRLEFLTGRCELILGQNWKAYPEGQRVAAEALVFQTKLNTDGIFEAWLKDSLRQNDRSMEEANIFKVVKNNSSKTFNYEVAVVFDYSIVNLFKEVRHLCWLGYDIPHRIMSNARLSRKIYPYAIGISESLQTWNNSLEAMQSLDELSPLLQADLKAITDLISSLLPAKWGTLAKAHDLTNMKEINDSHLEYLDEVTVLRSFTTLEELISAFTTKISLLQNARVYFNAYLLDLHSCAYDFKAFQELITKLQALVDSIVFGNLSGVDTLVCRLNDRIQSTLVERCADELRKWSKRLQEDTEGDIGAVLTGNPLRHEITITDATVSVTPPVEASKKSWFDEIHRYVAVVKDQRAITTTSVDAKTADTSCRLGVSMDSMKLNPLSALFNECVDVVESKFSQISAYANSWLSFQTLWDLEIEDVYETLGDDIGNWIAFYREFKGSRATFDTVEKAKDFGFAIVDYEHAQAKINARYDSWQRQITGKFAEVLNESMKQFDHEVVGLKKSLEAIETTDHLSMITTVTFAQNRADEFKIRLADYGTAESALVKSRFRFSADWITSNQLNDDFDSLAQILKKRQLFLESERANICMKIENQSARLNEEILKLKTAWDSDRPITGDLVPSFALAKLDDFERLMSTLKAEEANLSAASKILNIHISIPASLDLELEEVGDLKAVWTSIDTLWISLQDLKGSTWTNVSPREIRHRLEDLLSRSRNLPAKVRQYMAFEEVQQIIKDHIKANKLVTDMVSASFKQHHWDQIFKHLQKRKISLDIITLGDVWDLGLLVNDAFLHSVVAAANGEKAVEEEIHKIETHWQTAIFELFNYQGKIRFVKKWDTLFQQCNDDLSLLSSMQSSAHYKVYEHRGSHLIEQLNSLFRLLDTWIETQKQYVYVDGVFGGNGDIQKLLPLESSRFRSITGEFFLLLKNIFKSPIVLDSLNVPDVQRSMERTLDVLTKIKKSLNDYLEKQRELFPRFYFIGNEDFLEIIGNSHQPEIISKHLKKLFTGISGVLYEGKRITGVSSDFGETLNFQNSISLDSSVPLHAWLSDLEYEVKSALSKQLSQAILDLTGCLEGEEDVPAQNFLAFVNNYQAQVTILASQVCFTTLVERHLSGSSLKPVQAIYLRLLEILAQAVLNDITPLERKKYENLVIESIHQRDIVERLITTDTTSNADFKWRSVQRYYYDHDEQEPVARLTVQHNFASFQYGFEYLGVQSRLVYTPLIDKCYLSMTQALDQKIGGSPFGPAGTGKTESVKALGHNLGKMVLVFCCDESFDFQAMGRILTGVCQVGAWACFDEFNRLEEKILSAVSTQIKGIETGLSNSTPTVELLGKQLEVHPETGIFVTMNPGYAGRSELPENLKKLFRSFSMEKPDRDLITEVILNSQGFKTAKELSSKLVPFFSELKERCSDQTHYDFGLRSLKSVLVGCGANKRRFEKTQVSELAIVLLSLNESVAPKLTRADEAIFTELRDRLFGSEKAPEADAEFLGHLKTTLQDSGLAATDEFIKRSVQIYRMQETQHGIILYGQSGVGKTSLWKQTLTALGLANHRDTAHHIIDCKVLAKDQIYGSLNPITREWTDGVLTSILRKIKENARGELSRDTWIVFDGDIDPEWIENLNSVLDDNKALTLPNGERLSLPSNVRFFFEVDDISHATPATVSRCGIIYLGVALCTHYDLLTHLLQGVENLELDDYSDSVDPQFQAEFTKKIKSIMSESVLSHIVNEAQGIDHIMDFDPVHALKKFAIMLRSFLRRLDGQSEPEVQKFALKSCLLSCCWAFAGDSSNSARAKFSEFLCEIFNEPIASDVLTDYTISFPDCELVKFAVPPISLESHEVVNPDIIIPTSDTVKHEDLIYSVINDHTPLIMCGPPGSGKTMTFLSALRKSPRLEFVDLNFSKDTTPALLMQVLEQHCDYKKTGTGLALQPKSPGKWLVVFADEINLPKKDKYDTQTVISLLRQMIERRGFYKDNEWVQLSNVQFVGACNPSSDPGRNKLSMRFLKNVMVISVNYPDTTSLVQIYGAMVLAIFKTHGIPQYATDFTNAVIECYETLQGQFVEEVISPRDISRIVKGLYTYLDGGMVQLDEVLRLLVFHSIRVYSDKLSDANSRECTFDVIRKSIENRFPNRDAAIFKRPVLYSNWLSLEYKEVDEQELRSFVSERLRVFTEEVTDVSLVLFDSLLDHVLRIDRVLKQPQGHLILIGPSSSGKSTLTKFVSWINGYKAIPLSSTRNFTLEEFDEQLREVLRRTFLQDEKISFIVDESNIVDTAFLERMNNLLSSCEIPGLFGEDELKGMQSASGLEDSEFSSYFKAKIAENLHVVLTISAFQERSESKFLSSPALMNRCVIDWMGDWSDVDLFQVGSSLTRSLALDLPQYTLSENFERTVPVNLTTFRDVVVDVMIFFHRIAAKGDTSLCFTPGHFVKFATHFQNIFMEKDERLQEHQRHINVGLEKLRDTVLTVKTLKQDLTVKQSELAAKDKEANAMLSKMLYEQNEAERKREASIEIQIALEAQEKEIGERHDEVVGDLALVEPAVIEAARGVKNIKKEHLNELKAMRNPPESVVMTLESVCALLGYETRSWRDVQLIIRGDTFISDIVNFDNDKMCSAEVIEYMQQRFLSRADYNYETANRGSKACGPLLQWVEAQISYATILDKISPLREEVESLKQHTIHTKKKLQAVDDMINDLEASIERYKESYSSLIRDTEKIKSEIKSVGSKVEKSVRLMDDLTSERERWSSSIKRFHTERTFLTGDSLISAAQLSYCGMFDQGGRSSLIRKWRAKLSQAQIEVDDNYKPVTYLSSPAEIAEWQEMGIANDDFVMENMIMIKKSQEPSFIIDPSDKISAKLERLVAPKSLLTTSFLDDGFVKKVENALRFGLPILIRDGEHYDPVMNSILNGETERIGSRALVKLGKQLIDCAAGFKLFMTSKNPAIQIPSYVFSRTTVANFTITESSLINQSLNLTLKAERPEVEQQRLDLINLEGEYKVRLRKLEDQLLDTLSSSTGDILANEEILMTLQGLKTEAMEVTNKMRDTADVMATVDTIMDKYYPLASSCSVLFELLHNLQHLNPFYQFSLEFFTDILTKVLMEPMGSSLGRIDDLILKLHREVYSRVSLSMLNRDKVILALALFTLYHESKQEFSVKQVMNDITEQVYSLHKGENAPNCPRLDVVLEDDGENYGFIRPLLDSLKQIRDASGRAVDLSGSFVEIARFLFKTSTAYASNLDLEQLSSTYVRPSSPVILVSPEGFDPTFKVNSSNLVTIALGSKEATEIANAELLEHAKHGGSLLIQNVQMAPEWLEGLENLISSIAVSERFRLFLTCDFHSKIPVTLLRSSEVVTFENPPGIKAVLQESFQSTIACTKEEIVEKRHLNFLVLWFHAVVQERLRFLPKGFSKRYDFNNTDLSAALYIVDQAMTPLADRRSHVDPQFIPWETLQVLIGEIIYGGKVDVASDLEILKSLAKSIFTLDSFRSDFELAEGLVAPEGRAIDSYLMWIEALPDSSPASWIGLDASAEAQIQFAQNVDILLHVEKLIV